MYDEGKCVSGIFRCRKRPISTVYTIVRDRTCTQDDVKGIKGLKGIKDFIVTKRDGPMEIRRQKCVQVTNSNKIPVRQQKTVRIYRVIT